MNLYILLVNWVKIYFPQVSHFGPMDWFIPREMLICAFCQQQKISYNLCIFEENDELKFLCMWDILIITQNLRFAGLCNKFYLLNAWLLIDHRWVFLPYEIWNVIGSNFITSDCFLHPTHPFTCFQYSISKLLWSCKNNLFAGPSSSSAGSGTRKIISNSFCQSKTQSWINFSSARPWIVIWNILSWQPFAR